MSGVKGDCNSFSAVSDAPTAENSGAVPTDAGVREVSCVTGVKHLLCPCYDALEVDSGLWYGT